MTMDEWISVLKLSTMWEFDACRNLVIDELSKDGNIDPITKVGLAKQYKIPQWLFEGYETFIKRKEAISAAEAEQLGLATVVRLFHIREKSIARCYPRKATQIGGYGWGSPSYYMDTGPFDRTQCHCIEDIREEFEEELRELGVVRENFGVDFVEFVGQTE
jgi:hypothetical protein